MNKSNIIIGILAAIALVIGVVAYNKVPDRVLGAQGPQGPQGLRGEQGPQGPQGPRGAQGAPASPTLGALSGPDLPYPYFSFGGVPQWANRTDSLTQATTTVCALQSPSSTSTLDFASIRLDVSSTTAATVTLARAATAFATTTSLGAISVPANAQGIAVASTTGSHIFPPSTWFVVGMAGGIGTFSPSGSCRAIWVQS